MRQSIPQWLWIGVIIIPIIGLGTGYYTELEIANAGLFLATLGGAQASILAIVFAVTVLGIQIISQEYSPRMIELVTRDSLFRFTFFLFLFSIGADFLLLATSSSLSPRIFNSAVYAASGLAIMTMASLYAFIQDSINRLSPEGVIDSFIDSLSTDEYYNQVEDLVEDKTKNAHPLHPLYMLIMNALSGRERATAETGLDEYGLYADNTLDVFLKEDRFSSIDHRVSKQLFKPVLEEHLHDIALHAEEQDESKIVTSAIDWIYTLGENGLDIGDSPIVSRQAVWGLSDIIIHSPIESGNYLSHDTAWRKLGELMVKAAEYPRPQVVWGAAAAIKERAPQMLSRAHEGKRFRHSMTNLYRNMGKSHVTLLSQYENYVANIGIKWQYDHIPDGAPHREEISALNRLRKAFFRTTEAFLIFLSEEGFYPIMGGNFRDTWKEICVESADSEAHDYATVLCQALIEIAYIVGLERPEHEGLWVDAVARVKYNGNPEVVDSAFEQILSYEQREESPGIWTVDEIDERRQKYYLNLIQVREYQPLNTHQEFSERVEYLKNQVDERWRTLEEN